MNDTRCRSECRSGFTLLELMIALSILSTLMLVAWSMLASFRDVQEKGRVQATKTQTIRSIRLWLEEDALHLASPFQATATTRAMRGPSSSRNAFTTGRRPSGGAINNSTIPLPTNVDLIGTPTSIQWTIDSPSSPTQTFRQLFDSLDETVTKDDPTRRARSAQDSSPDSRINPRFAASRLSEPTTVGQPMLRPMQERVEYQLSSTGRGDEERWTLTRRHTPTPNGSVINGNTQGATTNGLSTARSRSEFTPFPVQSPADRILDSRDLFRASSEDRMNGDQSSMEEILWSDLANAAFRYSDGETWFNSWNSRTRGRAPAAIEFCFDLPAVRVRNLSELDEFDVETNLFDSAPSTFTEEAEARRDMEEIPKCDVRMVIRLPEVVQ